jgi:hypothetical protein
VVRVDGVFDEPAAVRLGQILADAAPGSALCVDLSHARACQESALAALAEAMGHRPEVRVDVLGPAGRFLERLRAPRPR